MNRIKFANILLECNPHSANYPALYCRSAKPFVFDEENGEWVLYGSGAYDFTTYFNALSVSKLQEYTTASNFSLHLELKGAACKITQTVAGPLASEPTLLEWTEKQVTASDKFQTLDLNIEVPDNTVLAGFVIETDGKVAIANSYYEIEIEDAPRNIDLALATTTFKKERYIESNIDLVKREIIDCFDDISDHFNMHVIDNGKTLNVKELESEHIKIHPNENVGGAGGFAYGMILAMEQNPKATHVLLMDDDVVVSPESLKRTFNLLRIVNDKYSDAFISGAMLSMNAGDEQWEDTGFMTARGTFCPAKPPLRLSSFDAVVVNEAFRPDVVTKETGAQYAAWWYCCIPVKVIEENGMPLPYFVRCDDAEYGVRCRKPFITMAGLCIWHESFHIRYNAAVERYQTTRNTLIAQFTTNFAEKSSFMQELHSNIRLELKKFAYDNAELVLCAFEDFLKGPDYYSTPGIAEKTFMEANRNKEKLLPLDEVENQAHRLGIKNFEVKNLDRQGIDSNGSRSLHDRLEDYATDNTQRFIKKEGSGYAVVPIAGWSYPAGLIHGKKYIIAIDWFNKTGAIREKDPKRYKAIKRRYRKDLKRFKKSKQSLKKAYSESRDVVTSVDFWKKYLNI